MPHTVHALFAFMLLMLAIPPSASAEGPSPEDIARRVEAFYSDRADIRAQFTQQVRKPGRRRMVTKVGRVFFKRPGMMRWEYTEPEPVFYISDGNVLWSYQPEDQLVTRLNVRSSELYHQSRYLFGQGDLTEDFELSRGEALEEEADLYPLVLSPRQGSAELKSLTLYVHLETGEIRRTQLIDPYDNLSVIRFERVEYRVMEESVFEFTPPPLARIQDLSRPEAATNREQ